LDITASIIDQKITALQEKLTERAREELGIRGEKLKRT
jgi:hypothetical protein